jgi:phosphoribosylanthranilate isomerase
LTPLLASIRAGAWPTIVKICGVRSEAGYQAACEAAAEMVGFNFVPGARRAVSPESARALLRANTASHRPDRVGVFRDQPVAEVLETSRAVGLDWVQLHGDESPTDVALLASEFGVVKALRATDAGLAEQIAAWRGADLLLLDAATPGSGETWSPAVLRDLKIDRPWVLAGGLTPTNVASLLVATGASGVDVASGVESDGVQVPALILQFCSLAHGAFTLRKP